MSVLIKGGRIVTAADDFVADEPVTSPCAGHFVRRARFGQPLPTRQRTSA